ncbi:uncharacterized protein EV420DRAFT_1490305, partial [Desarmillaria tabescens]
MLGELCLRVRVIVATLFFIKHWVFIDVETTTSISYYSFNSLTAKTRAEMCPQFQAFCYALQLNLTPSTIFKGLCAITVETICLSIERKVAGLNHSTFCGCTDDDWLPSITDIMTCQRSIAFAPKPSSKREYGVFSLNASPPNRLGYAAPRDGPPLHYITPAVSQIIRDVRAAVIYSHRYVFHKKKGLRHIHVLNGWYVLSRIIAVYVLQDFLGEGSSVVVIAFLRILEGSKTRILELLNISEIK